MNIELIAIVIAVYGAILSTILAIREIAIGRRKISVSCDRAVYPHIDNKIDKYVVITAVNSGYRPVEINEAGLLLNNGCKVIQMESKYGRIPLPKKLEDGDSVSIYFDFSAVQEGLQDGKNEETDIAYETAYVQDAELKTYRCKFPKHLAKMLAR